MVSGVVCVQEVRINIRRRRRSVYLWSKRNDKSERRLEEGMAVAGRFIRS